ncbi:MAG TPA: hypothetical protein VLL73_06480 [Desulfurivibrionaceae bacterium]|nr:hypothetical protein [Desulfurivibrionaceae bacterium]
MAIDPKAARLQQAINTVIEQQLADNDPPEMRRTLERLISGGLAEPEARALIGHVVVEELLQVIAAGKPFDPARYVGRLQRLPERP